MRSGRLASGWRRFAGPWRFRRVASARRPSGVRHCEFATGAGVSWMGMTGMPRIHASRRHSLVHPHHQRRREQRREQVEQRDRHEAGDDQAGEIDRQSEIALASLAPRRQGGNASRRVRNIRFRADRRSPRSRRGSRSRARTAAPARRAAPAPRARRSAARTAPRRAQARAGRRGPLGSTSRSTRSAISSRKKLATSEVVGAASSTRPTIRPKPMRTEISVASQPVCVWTKDSARRSSPNPTSRSTASVSASDFAITRRNGGEKTSPKESSAS